MIPNPAMIWRSKSFFKSAYCAVPSTPATDAHETSRKEGNKQVTDMVTRKRLDAIPDISSLKKLCQSLAILDAIMSPEWEFRYYSFNSKWAAGEMMASMRNGSGDEYFILFNSQGAIMKGFAHESAMSSWSNEPEQVWRGVLDEVPNEFAAFLTEPAFSITETTFCIWRRNTDEAWQTGLVDYPDEEDPDGSEYLLFVLNGDPATYQEFAEQYYECSIDLEAVSNVYQHLPLTTEIVKTLNPEVALESLGSDIDEIAYPGEF